MLQLGIGSLGSNIGRVLVERLPARRGVGSVRTAPSLHRNAPSVVTSPRVLKSPVLWPLCRAFAKSSRKPTAIPDKLIDALDAITNELRDFENPRLEASLLLATSLNVSREQVLIDYKRMLTESERLMTLGMVQERLNEKPLAYISGTKDFLGMDFEVNSHTLIPRPATETLVLTAARLMEVRRSDNHVGDGNHRFLDLGTGSGCVSISLLKLLREKNFNPPWEGVAVDINPGALEVAQRNSQRLLGDLSHALSFYRSDWCTDLAKSGVETKFNLVVSNPPYLTTWDWENVPKTIKDFEPPLAFVAGEDGLDCYRKICEQIPKILAPNAVVCLETGAWQENGVVALFASTGLFRHIGSEKDLDGHHRVVVLELIGQEAKKL